MRALRSAYEANDLVSFEKALLDKRNRIISVSRAAPRRATLYRAVPYCAEPRRAVPRHIVLCCAAPCHVVLSRDH